MLKYFLFDPGDKQFIKRENFGWIIKTPFLILEMGFCFGYIDGICNPHSLLLKLFFNSLIIFLLEIGGSNQTRRLLNINVM